MRIFFIFAADSWWHITEIGDIQGVSYSCFFGRYLRARVQALLNMRKFLKVRKSLLSLF